MQKEIYSIVSDEASKSSTNEVVTPALEVLHNRLKEFFRRFKQQINFSGRESIDSSGVSKVMPSFYRDESGEIKIKHISTPEYFSNDTVFLPDRYSIDSIIPDSIKIDGGASLITYQDRIFQVKKLEAATNGFDIDAFCREHYSQVITNYFGFPAPHTELNSSGQYLVSRFIEGKELSEIPNNSLEFEFARQELKKRFVLDCLLGNINEGPLDLSAYKLGIDGKLYHTGKQKKYDAAKPPVNLETLLESRKGHPIYGDLTDVELYEHIKMIENEYNSSQLQFFLVGEKRYSDNDLLSKTNVYFEKIYSRIENLNKYKEKFCYSSIEVQNEYLSTVTLDYLKKLDEIEIEGNPELKETIRRNIIQSELTRVDEYEQEATRKGITVEEHKRQLQENVSQAIENSRFFRATDWNSLFGIITSGRFKSQFETGTSHGYFNPWHRSTSEYQMFGFPKNSNDTAELVPYRPIYGYPSDNPEGFVSDSYGYSGLSSYGGIIIKFRDKVRSKTTVTFNDSLGSPYPPTPALAPHFTGVGEVSIRDKIYTSNTETFGSSYCEAQYHNQLFATDIEEIIITDYALGKIVPGDPIMGKNVLETLIGEFNSQNPGNTINTRYI